MSATLVQKWTLTTAGNVTATPTVYQGSWYGLGGGTESGIRDRRQVQLVYVSERQLGPAAVHVDRSRYRSRAATVTGGYWS